MLFIQKSTNGQQRELHLIETWMMTFCATGSNVILLLSGLWRSPSGLDVLFGSLHGKEEMAGVEEALLFKIVSQKKSLTLQTINFEISLFFNSAIFGGPVFLGLSCGRNFLGVPVAGRETRSAFRFVLRSCRASSPF